MYHRFSRYIILLIFLVTTAMTSFPKGNEPTFTVVIDAGHGGKDIGATDNGVNEKDINLKVARYLQELIKKKMKETKVVMTRSDDRYLTLQERADIANKNKGDLFISIHTNSVDKKNKNRKTVAGSSVYALGLHKDDNNMQVARRENSVIELEQNYEQKYSGFDPSKDESYIIFEMAQKKNLSKSIKFAEDTQKELVGIGRKDRGVHQAGFWVLWATSMPSVLIELDFICNPESAKYISSDKGAKELAEAIFRSLEKYRKSWTSTNSLSSKSTTTTYPDGTNEEYVYEDYSGDQEYSYVEVGNVANVKSRKKKTPAQSKPVANQNKNNGRKRRSADAREASNNKNYESDLKSLSFSENSGAEEIVVEETVVVDETVYADNKKSKGKKSKDNKDKKSKEKGSDKKGKKDKKDKNDTVYTIQILASSDRLKPDNPRFQGLSPITTKKENNLYKYYYGESNDLKLMEKALGEVRRKIPDAFIVSFGKNGKQMLK